MESVSEGALIATVNGATPVCGEGTWLAPNATLTGDVVMGRNCSVWFQAVIRGDVGAIRFGDGVNIQDGVVVHATRNYSEVTLGDRVSVGHRALVHGCTAEEDVLIGMGAIVMDKVYIERGGLVAAGAVVLENTRIKAGEIYAGVPAKCVKRRPVEEAVKANRKIAEGYVEYKGWYTREDEVR